MSVEIESRLGGVGNDSASGSFKLENEVSKLAYDIANIREDLLKVQQENEQRTQNCIDQVIQKLELEKQGHKKLFEQLRSLAKVNSDQIQAVEEDFELFQDKIEKSEQKIETFSKDQKEAEKRFIQLQQELNQQLKKLSEDNISLKKFEDDSQKRIEKLKGNMKQLNKDLDNKLGIQTGEQATTLT